MRAGAHTNPFAQNLVQDRQRCAMGHIWHPLAHIHATSDENKHISISERQPLLRVREYRFFEVVGTGLNILPFAHFGTHIRERNQNAANRYEVEWLEANWLRKEASDTSPYEDTMKAA